MGDESSSGVAPRERKFAPRIPPRKVSRAPAPKAEQADSGAGDVVDHTLRRLVKQAEKGPGRKSPMAERKAAAMEVTFGHVGKRTSARSFGTSGAEKKYEDAADIPVTKQKDYVEPWDYYSNYPVTLPLRRPYSGNPEILDEEEFGEASKSSEFDETKIDCAGELGLKDESANGRMLFFQLPVSLPLGKRPAATGKGKEIDGKGIGVLEKGLSSNDLPAGFVGKMLVYKSGAVKMKLGDNVFDVSPGSDCIFAQDVMAINTQQKHCCVLGEPNKRAIVRPDVDHLLSSLTE